MLSRGTLERKQTGCAGLVAWDHVTKPVIMYALVNYHTSKSIPETFQRQSIVIQQDARSETFKCVVFNDNQVYMVVFLQKIPAMPCRRVHIRCSFPVTFLRQKLAFGHRVASVSRCSSISPTTCSPFLLWPCQKEECIHHSFDEGWRLASPNTQCLPGIVHCWCLAEQVWREAEGGQELYPSLFLVGDAYCATFGVQMYKMCAFLSECIYLYWKPKTKISKRRRLRIAKDWNRIYFGILASLAEAHE